MRYTGPRNRIARREGLDLGMKTPGSKSHASLLKKLNIPPGQHGTRGKRKFSEHSKQLREKQKLKYLFNLSEKQMKNYFKKAKQKTGNTGLYLSQFLEKRFDNVVYRLGLAPTRAMARQLIGHKHLKINDKVMSIPSYLVRVGDIVSLGKASTNNIPAVSSLLERKDLLISPWLEKQGPVGKLTGEPSSEMIEKQINLRLVIEFYSR